MGRVKEAWMQSQERGWDAPDTYVCAGCVEDDFLKEIINDNLAFRKCSYCKKGSRGYIAAPVEALMPAISSGLHYYFNDPESAGVPYDEGDYIFKSTTTTEDALHTLSLGCHDDLFVDIANAFWNGLWTKTAGGHWAGTHYSEHMNSAWNHFVHTVKHKCRYFFSLIPPDRDPLDDRLSPAQVLNEIGGMASQFNLIKTLPTNTLLFRVRVRDYSVIWPLNFESLGPPPNEKATAGRMNPAGISYFYLATDQRTAIAETVNKPPCAIISAEFKTRDELIILDLCDLPKIPSLFDDSKHDQREAIYFLLNFVDEISKPITRNGQEHIDYVASQIVSEYFAKQFRTEDERIINGVKYPSAVRPGGINIVLFPPPKGFNKFAELVSMETTVEKDIRHWSDLVELII